MTLKEIQRQIDIAHTDPIHEDGTCLMYDLFPKVYYRDLPAKLKKEADKITVERVREFLYKHYTIDTLKAIAPDQTALDKKILEALHSSPYVVTSTNVEPPKPTGNAAVDAAALEAFSPVSLVVLDFLEVWESRTGILPTLIPSESFGTIRQGKATNALTKMRATDENTNTDPYTGETTINSSELALVIPKIDQIGTPTTETWQLFDIIMEEFTESGIKSRDIQITLDKYMKKRGLKDRKEARKQVTKYLELLRVSAINFTEPRGKSEPQGFYNLNISSGAGISKSGIITFSFSERFYNLIMSYPVMPCPPQLCRFNNKRNPNSYYFLRKLSEHKNMNIGKKNENTISVKTLIAASPYLPTYKKVMTTDRHLDKRIIEPFERDMDALSDTLTWEYCHKNAEPLSTEELSAFNYRIFIDCLIHVTWINYPDQTKRLKDKEERKNKRKKRKEKGG